MLQIFLKPWRLGVLVTSINSVTKIKLRSIYSMKTSKYFTIHCNIFQRLKYNKI